MFRLRIGSLVVLACMPLMACLHALAQYDPSQIMSALQFRQPGLTLVTSHRGEINGPYAENMPENSVGAAMNAIYGGIEMMEADVWTTQDHVAYLAHDKTTYRMLNIRGRGYFNPDPNGPAAVQWSAIANKTLCAGRGITDVAFGGSGQCTVIYDHVQTQSSLSSFISAVAPATNSQGQAWGGVILLDIRDQDSLVQSWTTLVGSPFTPKQVVFKGSPLVLGLKSVQDLVDLLAASPYYKGQAGHNVQQDLAAYMNFQPTYIANKALEQEKATGNPNWAIDDWNYWLANAGSFHRLLAAEVSVKGSPGEFITTDTLYQTVTNGPRNAISMYSHYHDCYDPNGPQNLPNLPPGSEGKNGYWINDGLCNTLKPTVAESADGIDHRYDYNFYTGHTSPNTPNITDPPSFAMVIADNAFGLISYLQNKGQRNLSSIYAHCTNGIQFPGCDDAQTPGQTTYSFCASEGGTCGFTGDRNVAFGANGHYLYETVSNGPYVCTLSNFGTQDPAPGFAKACYTSTPIAYHGYYFPYDGSIYCADLGGHCNYTGTAIATIAVNQKFTGVYNVNDDGTVSERFLTNGYDCTASQFPFYKSPQFSGVGACFYDLRQGYVFNQSGPDGYKFCSGEDGNEGGCHFKDLGRVAYGANGKFNYGVFNGGVACTNSVFGDPNPSVTKNCWYQETLAVSGVKGTGVGGGGGGMGGTSTCDLYASGGTPCVAAHSTTRALVGGYTGSLYQVKRASDNTTTDIEALSTNGYADSAKQDSFCTGTTCIISLLYDQSGHGNDLSIEGPGGNGGQDAGAVANALPITLHGNKVYGINVTQGVGYRNNATHGVSTGQSPEGMYMVTSGTNVNSGCCFDYGNVETGGGDTGEGHMDALNFGTFCEYTCSGPGPWVEADLENGQYQGSGANTADQTISYNFVTAMLKNDAKTTFALKGGNAQSGGLTTDWSGSLPTVVRQGRSYIPMHLEGAIVLGTGGDNSNSGVGSFFEGVMTSGYPTDATDDAVQANIVAAGYDGDSGGSGDTGGSVYTGPDDPGGPGPQDTLPATANIQGSDLMGTKPALASFKGNIYAAFQSDDSRHELYVSSAVGGIFPTATGYPSIHIGSAPAMTQFNNQLYVAFQGDDPDHYLFLTSSLDGKTFPAASLIPHVQMGSAPAMTVFNNQLCVAFQGNDADHFLFLTSSADGASFPGGLRIPNVQIGSAPAVAVFNNKLYVAFRANDPGNAVWIASSSDGVHFSSQILSGQKMGGKSAPALVASGGVLYYIYGANDTDNEMLVTASTDGSTWQGPKVYRGTSIGATGPAAAAYANGFTVGFQSNDSRHVLFTTSNVAYPGTVYTGPSDPGGPGPQDGFQTPAIIQSPIFMGTKPALASFNNYIYTAFQSNDSRHELFVTSTSIGTPYPPATGYPNIHIGSAPAMTVFKNNLYLGFQSDDPRHWLFLTSSSTGSNFSGATGYSNVVMGSAPALSVFNNQLYVAFQSDDSRHLLFLTSSSDGSTFPAGHAVSNVHMGSAPAMATFNGKLYVAFRADDASNNAWIATSSDGVNFNSGVLPGQQMGWSSSPALVVYDNILYYIYGANDSSNEMLVMASKDGTTWTGPKAYPTIDMGYTGPGATAYSDVQGAKQGISVGFQSNDARDVLFTTINSTVPY